MKTCGDKKQENRRIKQSQVGFGSVGQKLQCHMHADYMRVLCIMPMTMDKNPSFHHISWFDCYFVPAELNLELFKLFLLFLLYIVEYFDNIYMRLVDKG